MTPVDRSCSDFHRTGARRLGETPVSRRALLKLGLGTTLSVYAARALPFADALGAAESAAAAAPDAPVLVSVFIPGGLDLLDTVVPVDRFGRYADLRPQLKVTDAVAIGDGLALHPSMTAGPEGGLHGLYMRGQLGLLPGIDYAGPDLSHFNSRHFWETGRISTDAGAGWLGRWIDRRGDTENPFQALSLSGQLSPVLRGTTRPVAAVSSPDDAQVWTPGVWGAFADRTLASYRALSGPGGAPGPAAVRAAARQSRLVADRLAPYVPKDGAPDPLAPTVAYPRDGDGELTETARDLSHLAAMLSLPLGVRVATVETDGSFDTHDDQAQALRTDLAEVAGALAAFQADLAVRGLAQRVVTLVWTEFGRRPQENESAGTDHGAGGLAWVMGPRARGGLLSPYPDLGRFDRDDNLQVTVDFRAVYASLLEQWLGTGADEVLPDAGRVGRVSLIR